jgi:aminoglycoside/choline kinase family phosphotransferase
VFLVDEALGKILLEDFGDDTFYDLFSEQKLDIELYRKAVDDLVILYKADPLEGVDRYDDTLATIRGDFFLDDYLPAITNQESTPELYVELHAILKDIYNTVADVKWGTILWDYHSPNLMPVDGCVGVLDFQDAKKGPLSYDLASLLYDARFPFPKESRDLLFNYFVERTGIQDVQAFKDSFEMAGLLRNLGVLGRFARVAYRDKKPEFLPKIAVLWPYVDEALQNPKAEQLKTFLDENMLEEKRLAV